MKREFTNQEKFEVVKKFAEALKTEAFREYLKGIGVPAGEMLRRHLRGDASVVLDDTVVVYWHNRGTAWASAMFTIDDVVNHKAVGVCEVWSGQAYISNPTPEDKVVSVLEEAVVGAGLSEVVDIDPTITDHFDDYEEPHLVEDECTGEVVTHLGMGTEFKKLVDEDLWANESRTYLYVGRENGITTIQTLESASDGMKLYRLQSMSKKNILIMDIMNDVPSEFGAIVELNSEYIPIRVSISEEGGVGITRIEGSLEEIRAEILSTPLREDHVYVQPYRDNDGETRCRDLGAMTWKCLGHRELNFDSNIEESGLTGEGLRLVSELLDEYGIDYLEFGNAVFEITGDGREVVISDYRGSVLYRASRDEKSLEHTVIKYNTRGSGEYLVDSIKTKLVGLFWDLLDECNHRGIDAKKYRRCEFRNLWDVVSTLRKVRAATIGDDFVRRSIKFRPRRSR